MVPLGAHFKGLELLNFFNIKCRTCVYLSFQSSYCADIITCSFFFSPSETKNRYNLHLLRDTNICSTDRWLLSSSTSFHLQMSFSRSLAEYLVKCKENNFLLRAPPYKHAPLPKSTIDDLKIKTEHRLIQMTDDRKLNHSQLLKENYDLVGKGSNFERKSVQAQIKTLGLPYLKRVQNISEREPYPEERARYLSYLEKKGNDSTESCIHDQINEGLVTEIIETLIGITPKPRSETTISPIALNDKESIKKRSFQRHVYTEIPSLPEFGTDVCKFEEYVHALTHSTFHFKNSSKFNGVISKILKNLFHPLNPTTSRLRSLKSYNDVLHFYSLKWNIATCRELLLQMKLEGVTPNTTSYNIMLKNLLTLQNIQHVSNPYVIASKFLKQMKNREISADLVTWNLIFKLVKDDQSKAMLLKNRSLLNLPLDTHSVNTIVRYLVDMKDLDSYSLLKLIHSYDFTVDRKLMCLIVRQLAKEGHFSSVLKILDFFKSNFDISSEPLNLLLVHFSNIGRVDLVIAAINTFSLRYDVKPDAKSYNLVMKSFARSYQGNSQYDLWKVMYHQMLEDLDGVISGEYWIRNMRAYFKAYKNLKVELGSPLTPAQEKLNELRKKLVFSNQIPVVWNSINPDDQEYVLTAKKLGLCSFRPKKVPDSSYDPATLRLKQKQRKMKKNYKKRISVLSIQKAMVKRIPYAKDPYKALTSELRERKIIE